MAADLNLAIVMTADGRGVRGTVDGVRRDLGTLGREGGRAAQQLQRGFGPGLSQALTGVRSQIFQATTQLFTFRNLIGYVAGSAGLGLLLRGALSSADAIDEMSQRLGIGIEQLQEWNYGASLAGVGAGEFENSLRFLSRNMADAAEGTGEAIDAFARLGVSVATTDGALRPVGDVLLDVANRLSEIDDAAERTQLAMQLFGRSGSQMIPFLQDGAEGIAALAREARAAGAVMDEALVRKAGEVNDQLDALGVGLRTNFQAGMLNSVVGEFDDLHSIITDPAFQHDVQQFGQTVGDLLRFAVENFSTIVTVFTTIAGAMAGGRVAGYYGAAAGGAVGLLGGLEATGQTNFLEMMGLDSRSIDEQIADIKPTLEKLRALAANSRANMEAHLQTVGPDSEWFAATFEMDKIEETLVSLEQQYADLLSRKLNLETAAAPGFAPTPSLLAPPPVRAGGDGEDALGDDPRLATQAAIEGFIQALRDEQAALALSNAEREVAVNLMSAQQIAIDGGTLLTEAQAAAIRDATLANHEAREAEESRNRTMEEGRQLTEALRNPTEIYTATVARLRELLDAGAIGQETFNRGVAQAREEMEAADESAQRWQEGMQDLGSVVSSQFEDALLNGAKVSDMFRALEQDIIRIILRLTITKPLEGFLAGIADEFGGGGTSAGWPTAGAGHHPTSGGGFFDVIGGIFGSIFHEGGVVGGPAQRRLVPAATFIGAPKMHMGGIAGDEVPAILKKGEIVFQPNGAMRAPIGGAVVNIIDQRSADSAPIEQRRRAGPDGQELIEIIVPAMRDAIESGKLDGSFRNSFALRRAPS